MEASIKVVLYTSKTLSNNEHPVLLRIIKNRKTKYLSTGFKCSKDLWDSKNNLPKKKHPLYINAKVLIAQKKVEAEKLLLELKTDNKNLSVSEISNKLKKASSNNSNVFEYFDTVIDRFKNSGQIKNSLVYRDAQRVLKSYIKTESLNFSEITVEFLNKFEEFLKRNNKGGNTIFLYLRTLRALINKAIKEDICSEKFYAFKKFSLSKYTHIKTEKRALSKDDILKIKSLNINEFPHLVDAKHIFLFSYYCRGINFVDIASLQWKNIKSGRLIYTRQKTKELFNIEVFEAINEILAYYKPFTYENAESYIFPILNNSHKSPSTQFNRKQKILRKINADLKEIASLIGVENNLTTYVARHSYATILKKSGVPLTVISEAMGHDSEKTTKIYLESFENNILDDASKFLI